MLNQKVVYKIYTAKQSTSTERTTDPPPTFQIIGDNVDLRQHPSHQTLERRNQDHHWFHLMAVRDRVSAGDISVTDPTVLVKDLGLHTILPSIEDCKALNDELVVLVARVLTTRLEKWQSLSGCVPTHIQHKYSNETAMKSEIVSGS